MNQEDIQVTEIRITDTFRYGGMTFHGLKELMAYSIDGYSKKMGWLPFVVRKMKSYPCFDSSDSAYENRFYQAYYLTMDKAKAALICEETRMSRFDFLKKNAEEQYPVMEPMFSMSKIKERHLPYIYYHGEGDFMEVVEDRHAQVKVEILSRPWRPIEYDEPFPCLYGPPTDLVDDMDMDEFDEMSIDDKNSGINL